MTGYNQICKRIDLRKVLHGDIRVIVESKDGFICGQLFCRLGLVHDTMYPNKWIEIATEYDKGSYCEMTIMCDPVSQVLYDELPRNATRPVVLDPEIPKELSMLFMQIDMEKAVEGLSQSNIRIKKCTKLLTISTILVVVLYGVSTVILTTNVVQHIRSLL